MPKWLISAAMPRPAARPAIGPIHERRGATGAGVGLVVGLGAACAGLAGGASGVRGGGVARCMPLDRPAPRRAASASGAMEVRASAKASIKAASGVRFIGLSRQTGNPEYEAAGARSQVPPRR